MSGGWVKWMAKKPHRARARFRGVEYYLGNYPTREEAQKAVAEFRADFPARDGYGFEERSRASRMARPRRN